jgi:hypothetical protein
VADPLVVGGLASHPRAAELVAAVHAVHLRYAREVVGAFGLCPFMNDPESAFGRFCVVLDRQLDVPTAREVVLAAPGVVHVVYPLVRVGCHAMERFGNALHEAVRREVFTRGESTPPVHATFHPEMEGDTFTPARRIGLVRRAPDPFVQFVPQGLTGGGSTFLDPATLDLAALLAATAKPRGRVASLGEEELEAILARLTDLRREREASYPRLVDEA